MLRKSHRLANVPIEVIYEALGHFSVKTTEIHLDSFESGKRAGISRHLLPVGGGGLMAEEEAPSV